MSKKNVLHTAQESGAFTKRASDFKVGQRVEMTDYAKEHLRPGKKSGITGRVVGHEHTFGIRVLQDGYKRPTGYAAWFWRKARK